MAGVLSRAAGRIATGIRPPTFVLTTVARSPFAARANAPIPRLVHTEISQPEQLRVLVKEAIDAEVKEMKATSWERYESLSSRLTALADLSSTRHAEMMAMYIHTQERAVQVTFRVCAGMVALAAASNYQDEIRKILLRILSGGSPGQDEGGCRLPQR